MTAATVMDLEKQLLPKSPVEGLIPTMNQRGWMTEALDDISVEFARYAGQVGGEALDLGCAYGVATLRALKAGARVLACDMEPKHLELLLRLVPDDARERVTTQSAVLPNVQFDANRFSAVLAARVLHFLNGDDVVRVVTDIFNWLVPGGRFFWVTDTPHAGPWKVKSAEFDERKAAGEDWPGFFENYRQFLPPGVPDTGHPHFINVADPDILERVCQDAGFKVMRATWLKGSTPRASDRDHAGVIAEK